MSNQNEEKPYEKLKSLEDALKLAKDSGNISDIFHAILNLGKFCYEIRANELGLKYIQEAIELYKVNPACTNIHEFFKLLGDFNFELGSLDEAIEAYNISIKEIPKKESFKQLAQIYFKIGRIYFLQDNLKQAVNQFKKAEKIFEESGLYIEQAKICNQIGLMYINKIPISDLYEDASYMDDDVGGISSFKKAKKYYKKAKMILEKNNLVETESELYNSIQANLTSKWKDFRET